VDVLKHRKELDPKNRVFWNVLRRVFKLLAAEEAQKIILQLLKKGPMRSTVLLTETALTESQFHPTLKQLVKSAVVEKTVGPDRSVTYSISAFGEHVLELSEPLLKTVKEKVAPELIQSN